MARRIAILGSTGSIGQTTLQVVRDHPREFTVSALSAHRNLELLTEQIEEFRPQVVCVTEQEQVGRIGEYVQGYQCKCCVGAEGLLELIEEVDADLYVVATVGAAGFLPVVRIIERGKPLALANKEVLVMAGGLIKELLMKTQSELLPIDSELTAIHQCVRGASAQELGRVIITASGGPFREVPMEELAGVSVEQALQHPTWQMGRKITVDSATLMNKGFEVLEASLLFQVPLERVEVLIHPQSIIHCMVEFIDGSIMAQLSVTDMYLPIHYVLHYPERVGVKMDSLDFSELQRLEFETPDERRFPCLRLAYEAGRLGGTFPTVLNAANEVAVERFLKGEIVFTRIAELLEKVLEEHEGIEQPDVEEVLEVDSWAGRRAGEL